MFLVNLAARRPTKSTISKEQSYKGCDQNIGKKILSTVPIMTDMNRKTFNDLENRNELLNSREQEEDIRSASKALFQ